MDIDQIIAEIPEDKAKSTLSYLLNSYMNPAFGALPKNEVELIMLNVLESLNIIDPEPELYQLVSKLKITRSKARGLIYDRELRRSSESDLDEKVKTLLKRPLIQKNGDLYVLEVENPLISDHLRSKIQKLGYVSDGSFSPSLIKLGLDAISALIESYLSDQEKNQLTAILVEAGAPDTSFSGIIKATLKKAAAKVASDSGEVLMDKASEFITPIIDAGFDLLRERVSDLFEQNDD
ncbi:hypothetical protein [Gynuella sunshinyii]|uniref:Uncharacterized protein n=1 Tax=Gynuella sunshinyii YC6258 TaxID=1445510 RepID=A0A0C5VNG7_9GAMM|nr:hypothetical protein [Gynuella sunshinyii]AJQ96227.1 hypothetical Protein YC6258_04193 [Gynuella sunshinyii YC6258]